MVEVKSLVHGNTVKQNVEEEREDAYQDIISVLGALQENESTYSLCSENRERYRRSVVPEGRQRPEHMRPYPPGEAMHFPVATMSSGQRRILLATPYTF